MRPVFGKLRRRAEQAADRTGPEGQPAGQASESDARRASARDRGRIRRQIRRLRRRRDALLLELGGLVMELHRQGRGDSSDLVKKRAEEVGRVDGEARALARALESGERVDDLVVAGITGTCQSCGDLVSTEARFCASCGVPVRPPSNGDAAPASANGTAAPSSEGKPVAAER